MSEDTAKYDIPTEQEMSPGKHTSVSPGWRIANFIMAAFFFLAGMANTNDNDWYIWTPIYLYASGLCVVACVFTSVVNNALWQVCMWVQMGVAIVMGVYQVALLCAVSHKMDTNPLAHEEGREMGGLLIILAWTGITRFSPFGSPSRHRQQRHQSKPGGPSTLMMGLLVVSLTLAVVPLVTWSLCFVGDWHRYLGHCSGMFK